MNRMRYLICGATLAASLAGVASSSAATWDPQGVAVTATSSNSRLTDNAGNFVACTSSDARLTAVGDLATASPAPSFGGTCTASFPGNPQVTTFGTWTFTATSTTSVDVTVRGTGAGGTGPVAQIHFPSPNPCTITVDGPIHISGNTWSNATHQLTINSAQTFPLTPNAGCLGIIQSPGRLHATYTLPSSVVIT